MGDLQSSDVQMSMSIVSIESGANDREVKQTKRQIHQRNVIAIAGPLKKEIAQAWSQPTSRTASHT